jgi:hypothetical protein
LQYNSWHDFVHQLVLLNEQHSTISLQYLATPASKSGIAGVRN